LKVVVVVVRVGVGVVVVVLRVEKMGGRGAANLTPLYV
jgi:hypothetical protein